MQTHSKYSHLTVYRAEPLNAGTPLEVLRRSFLTPQKDFFIRTHGPVPEIDQAHYRLIVTGLVQRRLEISLEELREHFQAHTVTATLQCAGSRRNELAAFHPMSGGELLWGGDSIGTATWRGILLRDILRAAKVRANACYVAFEGLDAIEEEGKQIHFGSSISLARAESPEVLLAYEMNGAPLTPEHGFPLRVLVPGYIGARSVKWLQEITVQDQPSTNRFQTSDYKVFPPTTTAETVNWDEGKMLEEIALNAVICTPCEGETRAAGVTSIQGYAIAGEGAPIERVELSTDGGATWILAQIVAQEDVWTWCFWEATLDLPPGDYHLAVRVWDAAGRTQPEYIRQVWNFKGYANNAWHRVQIHLV